LKPERSRKLSKSSEDIPSASKSPKKLDNVFVPFAKLTQSIQNLSSSIGQTENAAAAHYQYVSLAETPSTSSTSTREGTKTAGSVSQTNLSADIEQNIVKTGTKSLIMII